MTKPMYFPHMYSPQMSKHSFYIVGRRKYLTPSNVYLDQILIGRHYTTTGMPPGVYAGTPRS